MITSYKNITTGDEVDAVVYNGFNKIEIETMLGRTLDSKIYSNVSDFPSPISVPTVDAVDDACNPGDVVYIGKEYHDIHIMNASDFEAKFVKITEKSVDYELIYRKSKINAMSNSISSALTFVDAINYDTERDMLEKIKYIVAGTDFDKFADEHPNMKIDVTKESVLEFIDNGMIHPIRKCDIRMMDRIKEILKNEKDAWRNKGNERLADEYTKSIKWIDSLKRLYMLRFYAPSKEDLYAVKVACTAFPKEAKKYEINGFHRKLSRMLQYPGSTVMDTVGHISRESNIQIDYKNEYSFMSSIIKNGEYGTNIGNFGTISDTDIFIYPESSETRDFIFIIKSILSENIGEGENGILRYVENRNGRGRVWSAEENDMIQNTMRLLGLVIENVDDKEDIREIEKCLMWLKYTMSAPNIPDATWLNFIAFMHDVNEYLPNLDKETYNRLCNINHVAKTLQSTITI